MLPTTETNLCNFRVSRGPHIQNTALINTKQMIFNFKLSNPVSNCSCCHYNVYYTVAAATATVAAQICPLLALTAPILVTPTQSPIQTPYYDVYYTDYFVSHDGRYAQLGDDNEPYTDDSSKQSEQSEQSEKSENNLLKYEPTAKPV
jgi:hypothetical protein